MEELIQNQILRKNEHGFLNKRSLSWQKHMAKIYGSIWEEISDWDFSRAILNTWIKDESCAN